MAIARLHSYLHGRWLEGDAAGSPLLDPATEEVIAELVPGPTDLGDACAFARDVGGPELRALSYGERAVFLRAASRRIHERRDELIAIAMRNGGNTRGDAKFDIDGASGTLAAYADLGDKLGRAPLIVDGEGVQLGRAPRLFGAHVLGPRAGVAVHVNAFNFPAWGTFEKAACAWLAGMPVISKPASATAWLAERMTSIVADLLPAGAFQLLLGPVGNLLDLLGGQDVLAFTGSGATGARLRGHASIVSRNVRVNIEADSLNAALLAPDVEPGSPSWDLFVNEISKDVVQKTGQKCTATRRILVPADRLGEVQDALIERLAAVRTGNPADDGVTMGPLASKAQLADVRAGVDKLRGEAEVVFAGTAPSERGFFLAPHLLVARPEARHVHEHEVFGPVATLIVYDGAAKSGAALIARGGGSLVASIYGDDRAWLGEAARAAAPFVGRIYLGSAKVAGQTAGPGTVLPQLVHGGPGKAGGGEELGGLRGLGLYSQRTGISGDRALLDAISGVTPEK